MQVEESPSLSPTKKREILKNSRPFNKPYPRNPYKTHFERNGNTYDMHVANPTTGDDLNMNMSLLEYRKLNDSDKLTVHDTRIRALRQRFCPVSMVNPNGTLHLPYFDSKPMALEWTDLEKAILLKGIFQYGLATPESWNNIIKDWLPQRTPIEIKLQISILIGRQDLSVYSRTKFENELQISRERKKNKRRGKKFCFFVLFCFFAHSFFSYFIILLFYYFIFFYVLYFLFAVVGFVLNVYFINFMYFMYFFLMLSLVFFYFCFFQSRKMVL